MPTSSWEVTPFDSTGVAATIESIRANHADEIKRAVPRPFYTVHNESSFVGDKLKIVYRTSNDTPLCGAFEDPLWEMIKVAEEQGYSLSLLLMPREEPRRVDVDLWQEISFYDVAGEAPQEPTDENQSGPLGDT